MIRTYDVFIRTRIPNQKVWSARPFRVRADREFIAINDAFNLARRNYITSLLGVTVVSVPTLASRVHDGFAQFIELRLPRVWRYFIPNKVELVSGDVVGLRAVAAAIARRFS